MKNKVSKNVWYYKQFLNNFQDNKTKHIKIGYKIDTVTFTKSIRDDVF